MAYSVVVCLLLLLPCFISAIPVKNNNEGSILSRVARDTGLIRAERQSNGFRCQNEGQSSECVPDGFVNVPSDLVNCLVGQCVCKECFMKNSSSGKCQTCSDYLYSVNQSVCAVDNRPRQLTAFLLSLFLSSTGAANFYIGQSSLAGGQLFLLILTFATSYFMCCLPCCLACCLSKEDVKGSVFFILFMILAVVVVILTAIAVWAWWIADLVIFATNQRLSGSGCQLTQDL